MEEYVEYETSVLVEVKTLLRRIEAETDLEKRAILVLEFKSPKLAQGALVLDATESIQASLRDECLTVALFQKDDHSRGSLRFAYIPFMKPRVMEHIDEFAVDAYSRFYEFLYERAANRDVFAYFSDRNETLRAITAQMSRCSDDAMLDLVRKNAVAAYVSFVWVRNGYENRAGLDARSLATKIDLVATLSRMMLMSELVLMRWLVFGTLQWLKFAQATALVLEWTRRGGETLDLVSDPQPEGDYLKSTLDARKILREKMCDANAMIAFLGAKGKTKNTPSAAFASKDGDKAIARLVFNFLS